MAGRRFVPLIAAVVAGVALLVLRLFQVQVLEHSTWAGEAANLVRSGAIRPYTRGAILDARGRVLRSDVSSYRVDFVYRDFRRKHPLGIVAHARSALTGRPVELAETLAMLEPWIDELVELTPGGLDAFARGEELRSRTLFAPSTADPEREERRARRADARFYVVALFDLDRDQARAVSKAARDEPERTWLELAAQARELTPDGVRERLGERARECRGDLEALASALQREWAVEEPSAAPLEDLLAALERHRERVENDSASALFREAAGFSAHRVDPDTLLASARVEWVAARLDWDAERLRRWLVADRAEFRRALAESMSERITAQLEFDAHRDDAPERVISRWAAVFAAPSARAASDEWRTWSEITALDEFDDVFVLAGDDEPLAAGRRGTLPFQIPSELVGEEGSVATWISVARAELGPSAAADELERAAEEWRQAFDGRFDRDFVRSRTAGVLARWDQAVQFALHDALVAQRRTDAVRGSPALLELREERLDRAAERARFVLRDHGSRPRTVLKRPSYDTAHLLTRHRGRFAGFLVQDTHERVARQGADGKPVAAAIIGDVGVPTIREELLARDLRDEFHALARKGVRAQGESEELLWLAQRVTRPDEVRGRSGIEAYFDPELAGRNGYRESRGIQDLIDGSYELDVPPVDGLDLTLTLDLDLQEAAAATLATPAGDPNPQACDYAWLAEPTGAIVLMRVDGAVLAAASHPQEPRGDETPPSPADAPLERTLRKPTFQPPGSSFKPFVAAWALEHLDAFDPTALLDCAMLPDGDGAGYVDVHCNVSYGHGAVDLHDSLKRSCNSYFAMLGDRLDGTQWRLLANEFGFGQETGVRVFGRRPGLREDSFGELFAREPSGRSKRLAGNGLAVVEATPMQLARATAGLATGVLPQARLVERIGSVDAPRAPRKLAISEPSLAFVRSAMEACANDAGGSAREALNEGELGWRMCAKTGSADIAVERVETADGRSRVRKHTWLIGWFPAREPRYVVVVFCFDTLQTASHSAVWVARQFLQSPAVRALVEQDGGAK